MYGGLRHFARSIIESRIKFDAFRMHTNPLRDNDGTAGLR